MHTDVHKTKTIIFIQRKDGTQKVIVQRPHWWGKKDDERAGR